MLTKNIKVLFTLTIVLFPIFSRYSVNVPFLTLAEFLVACVILVAILFGLKRIKIEQNLMFFCFYLIVEVVLAIFRGIASFDLIGSTFRLLFYYAIVAFFTKKMFDIAIGEKMLVTVGVITGVYGIFQVAFSYIGIYLPTYFHFLPLINGKDSDLIVLERVSLGMRYRAQSIFNEPAHLCTYLVLALAVLLFSESRYKHWKIYAAIITLACAISLSSTGIICLVILWGGFFWRSMLSGKIHRNAMIATLMAVSTGLIVSIRFNILQYFLSRTFANTGKLSGIFQSTRFVDLKHTFDNMDSISSLLFGNGIVDMSSYLPGFARLFNCLGLIGFVIMVLVLLKLYRSADELGRKIMFLYIILNFGTEVMFGNWLVLYIPYIISRKESIKQTTRYLHVYEK